MSENTIQLIDVAAPCIVLLTIWWAHRRGEKAHEAVKKLNEPPQHEIDELVDACGRFTL